jgi:poly-gamma-glutamate capsule biosynthesis protein CapA/YwtB (metallophosphatase superfamily)
MKYVIAPSYLETKNTLTHSAKGTTWKDHKYIKKINGVYYYTKEELSNAIKSGKVSASQLKSDLDARKELGKINKETNDSVRYVINGDSTGGINEPLTNAHGAISFMYDKNGKEMDANQYYWNLDQAAKKAAKKYSNTKLSKIEENNKVVSKILDVIYNSSKENEAVSNFGKHHPNGQSKHIN